MISVRGLRKHYQVHKRPPGLKAALRSLFHRSYTTVKAVDGISFDISPGERVGFLGPNGAGKTTTLKVLVGPAAPHRAARCAVDGHVPQQPRGRLPQADHAGDGAEAAAALGPAARRDLRAQPRHLRPAARAVRADAGRADRRCWSSGDLISKPTRQLSLGERMKCELAAALLHRPHVLFLDEPTIGLDVSMQATMRDFIRALQRALRRHGAPHQPLHGRRGRALPAGHRHRQGRADLRRRPGGAGAAGAAGEARGVPARRAGGRARALEPLGEVVSHDAARRCCRCRRTR